MALVVIAVAVTAALTGFGRALHVAARTEAFTRTVLPMEELLFDLETGQRPDLMEEGGESVERGETFQVTRSLAEPESVLPAQAPQQPRPASAIYRLEVMSSGPREWNRFRSELYLTQEAFS